MQTNAEVSGMLQTVAEVRRSKIITVSFLSRQSRLTGKRTSEQKDHKEWPNDKNKRKFNSLLKFYQVVPSLIFIYFSQKNINRFLIITLFFTDCHTQSASRKKVTVTVDCTYSTTLILQGSVGTYLRMWLDL